jgi:hypothetical protein
MSEWRNFQQNDPRVWRAATYSLTQQSNSAIRTRIPTKLSSTIIAFLVNSQPRSEVNVNVKKMRSTWILWNLWILFHARAKWMYEMRDIKSSSSRARARTLLLSLSRRDRDPETLHWTVRGTQAPESYWTQMCLGVRCNFAACVKRARGNFGASTNGSLPHSDLWYDQFSGLLRSVILV